MPEKKKKKKKKPEPREDEQLKEPDKEDVVTENESSPSGVPPWTKHFPPKPKR